MPVEYRPRWHPFLAADEREPGVWTLVDSMGCDYARVRIVRVGSEVGYLAESDTRLVGRYRTLRAALEAAHHVFVRSHALGGAPNGGKGYVAGT
ncbi:hypothetical protein [Agromyces indicus]|uniref:Uncharacterized protein n=1 Tax=Agromyces indicus TaxID=758919 RepID=A0ABU1FJ88_9MICO|nr:hypothetical protein [Agromyces indicus]MDR5691825.1 hypothetical protein [Agromyces indicus]